MIVCVNIVIYQNMYVIIMEKRIFDMQNELAIGDYTLLLMLYNSKTNKFGLKASGEGEAVIDINFCPKCGRNL